MTLNSLLLHGICFAAADRRDTAASAAITTGGIQGLHIRVVDSAPDKGELPSGALDARFAKSLKTFLTTPSSVCKDAASPLFLRRTMAMEERASVLVEGTLLSNGLECKVCVSTMKVSYVRDTEDVFFRPKREHRQKGCLLARRGGSRSKRTPEQMKQQLQQWLRLQVSELPPNESSDEGEGEGNEQGEDAYDAAEALAGSEMGSDDGNNEEQRAEKESTGMNPDGDGAAEPMHPAQWLAHPLEQANQQEEQQESFDPANA